LQGFINSFAAFQGLSETVLSLYESLEMENLVERPWFTLKKALSLSKLLVCSLLTLDQ
jgi:hypothetical protein